MASDPIPQLKLHPTGRHRILRGHPWVFENEVFEVPESSSDIAHLFTSKGTFLGTGVYNPKSQIIFRRFSREKIALHHSFLSQKITQAIQYRKSLSLPCQAQRLVWSESDGLPGLIVDWYAPYVVIQILKEHLNPKAIIARNDVQVRALEGLPQEKKVLWGEAPVETEIKFAGLRIPVDVMTGHKTGFYLDQIQNYLEIASFCKNRKVLDLFSFQGGFALSALRAGAQECLAVDQDARALERAQKTAQTNQLTLQTQAGNVFDLLRSFEQEQRSYDLIILDPPSFTKSKANLESAMRGYHEIHLRAIKLLSPGGLLASFCCSHNVSEENWKEMISLAASDVHTPLRYRQTFRQNPDHPIILQIPETSYLIGFLYEKISS
jgi:23S rRNA (cytosine1962-C5)-methyltransferase